MNELITQRAVLVNDNRAVNLNQCQTCSLKNESEWLNSKSAAHLLGISERTLFNLTSAGKIPYYKFGRRNRYKLEDLHNLLSAQPRGGFYVNKV